MLKGEQKEGTLVEHLEELRSVIIKMLLSILILFPLLFYYSDTLLAMIIKHFCPAGLTLKYFSPVEPLLVKLKLSFYAAVFVAAPYLLRQIWSFVAPGLYLKERSVTGWLLFSSWFLFLLGSIFSVYIILPLVMSFSMGFESVYLQAAIGIGHFVSLLLMLMLGFGIMFQFPPVVFVIVSTGLVRVETLKSYRALVFVGVFIVSALLTPPDVFSQLLMGLPTYLLFEVGLLAASFTGSRYDKESEDSEKADLNSGKETDDCEKIYEEANSEDKDR